MIGQKFNKLTILEITSVKNKKAFICKCDCGNITIVSSSHLKSNHTKSCGCLKLEASIKTIKEYNRNNPGKYNLKTRTARAIWHKCKKGDITFEKFLELSNRNCYYCNAPPSNFCSEFRYSGLDRVDSNIGYVLNNVVPCCKWCNFAKRERTQEEFSKWLIDLNNRMDNW